MREEEGREPGKGKVFAVYTNSNSKEEWMHPSSNQVSTPLFEGRTIIADTCMNPWQSSCVPGRNSLASQFIDLRTGSQPHIPLQISTSLHQDAQGVQNTNSVFSGSSLSLSPVN